MEVWNEVEWQEEVYDADCSDVEGLFEMPCPVDPCHQNYPLVRLEEDIEFSYEYFRQLREDGNLLPVEVVQITRVMQTFRNNLNRVLEAASSRLLTSTAMYVDRDPDTERPPTRKFVAPSSVSEDRDRMSRRSDTDEGRSSDPDKFPLERSSATVCPVRKMNERSRGTPGTKTVITKV